MTSAGNSKLKLTAWLLKRAMALMMTMTSACGFYLATPAQALPVNMQAFAVTGHIYSNPNEFDRVVEKAHRLGAQTIIVLGDYEANASKLFSAYERKFGMNFISLPGNHEFNDNFQPQIYSSQNQPFGEFQTENSVNIFLDTTKPYALSD